MKPIKFKPYSIMDKLGLDDNCQFEFFFSYLDHYYQHLSKFCDISNMIDPKAFLLRGVSKILDIEQSTHLLASENRDINSILVLTRTALDYFSVLNLFYNKTSNEEERLFRIILYELDGLTTRIKMLQHQADFDPRHISKQDYDKIIQQCNNAKESDEKVCEYLRSRLSFFSFIDTVNRQIISNNLWKYKHVESEECYKWKQLYNIYFNDNVSSFSQHYLSHYVHGLAISDIQYFSEKSELPNIHLSMGISIMGHLLKMIQNIFADDVKELDEEFKTNIIPCLIESIPHEVIAKICDEIFHCSTNVDIFCN